MQEGYAFLLFAKREDAARVSTECASFSFHGIELTCYLTESLPSSTKTGSSRSNEITSVSGKSSGSSVTSNNSGGAPPPAPTMTTPASDHRQPSYLVANTNTSMVSVPVQYMQTYVDMQQPGPQQAQMMPAPTAYYAAMPQHANMMQSGGYVISPIPTTSPSQSIAYAQQTQQVMMQGYPTVAKASMDVMYAAMPPPVPHHKKPNGSGHHHNGNGNSHGSSYHQNGHGMKRHHISPPSLNGNSNNHNEHSNYHQQDTSRNIQQSSSYYGSNN